MVIKFLGRPQPVELVRPSSFAERLDVRSALEVNPHRALAAALGLCWPRVRRRTRYNGDALSYGGIVLDQLDKEGADVEGVMVAALAAFHLCVDIVSDAEVSEALGNSEAPAGPSI